MAKLVVVNEQEPSISVVFEYIDPADPVRPQGWHGKCTGCGRVIHRWQMAGAFDSGQRHVDNHTDD
jgi:hypothetical protein